MGLTQSLIFTYLAEDFSRAWWRGHKRSICQQFWVILSNFKAKSKFHNFDILHQMTYFQLWAQKSISQIFAWIVVQEMRKEILNRGKNGNKHLMEENFDIFAFLGSTLKISQFLKLLISNILHQTINFEIFDGKNLMSKFARIFVTYFAIIIIWENSFLGNPQLKRLELFFFTAR